MKDIYNLFKGLREMEFEELRAREAKLRELLSKAILWTDEENDVGPWRDEARQYLKDTAQVVER